MRIDRPPQPSLLARSVQVFACIAYVVFTAVHAVLLSWLLLIPRFKRETLANALIQPTWGWYSYLLTGMHARVIGGENLPAAGKGYLYAANHESFLDIPLLVYEIGRAFLMKKSVLYSPIGWGGYLMGCIGVERGHREARQRALEQTLDMAKRSRSVMVFPEGTFGHRDGTLRAPHLNLLRHAWDRGLSVVPLGHAGTRRGLDGQALPFRRGAEVVLVVRPPLDPHSFPDRTAFAEACWSEVASAVVEARAAIPKGWPYPDELPVVKAA